MIDQIYIKTSEAVLSALTPQTKIKKGGICNPQEYFGTTYRLLSGVLGIVANNNLNSNTSSLSETFSQLESTLSKECVFVKNYRNSTITERAALENFNNWFEAQEYRQINLSDLYERLLLLEFSIQNETIISNEEKQGANSIGSFYTPVSLADKIVELTLDNYIFRNAGVPRFATSEKTTEQTQKVADLMRMSTFADYSCGTGSFLLAILKYAKNRLYDSKDFLRTIALNFHAIEADSLSLEIAKLQVLDAISDFSFYSELSEKFIHGNPLIEPSNEYPTYKFYHEFYYQNDLALNRNQIRKCDVIVGNPPWGTVGFDLPYHFHLLYPELNTIEDETELETALGNLEETHADLYEWLLNHDEASDLAMEEIYNDNRFEHSSMGGLHTNVLFTELCDSLCTKNGTVGLLLKGSTLSGAINKRLVNYLSDRKRISARYDFINTNKIFNIDADEAFSILILGLNDSEDFIHTTGITKLSELA
jgi:hypothetical protein